jgi:DNA-binding MarR family transcriptional regulator
MKHPAATRTTKLDKRGDLEGTTIEELSAQPGHLVRRCQQLALAIWMEETAEFDITPVQYAALAAIAAHPGVDATRLSDLISFDRSTLGDVLERIEGRGWVTRRAVAADRRKKTLWLTVEGKDIFRRVTPNMFRAQEKFMRPLSAPDRALFVELAARLVGLHTEQGLRSGK